VRCQGRRLWTITAFTVGHSVTLSLAVLGVVRVPPAPVEALIAVTIFVVAVAVELTCEQAGREGWMRRAPWLMAFVFGLLHGLGFAGALAQVGLPAGAAPRELGASLGMVVLVGGASTARSDLLPGKVVPWTMRRPSRA